MTNDDRILVWGGTIAVAPETYTDVNLYRAALTGQTAAARAAAVRRGVHLADHHEPDVVAVDAVLLTHPSTGAPMLVEAENAAADGTAAAGRPCMKVTLAGYRGGQHPVRKCVQAKHLTYARFIAALVEAQGDRVWTMRHEVEALLSDFPPYVVRAKAVAAIKHGLMHGCVCGCRGDWEVAIPSKMLAERVAEFDTAVSRSSL